MRKAFSEKTEQFTPFYINRNFALLWGGQTISVIGDFVFDITITLWLATVITAHLSWSPLAVSGALLAASLPTFLIGPLAGVFADRWNKRHTMLRMDLIRACLILLLIPLTGLVPLPFLSLAHIPVYWKLGIIYSIVCLATICAQFFNPSRFVLIRDVVPVSERTRASSLGLLTQNMAAIIGPALAAPFFFTIGIQWALLINALSFLISFLAILLIRLPKPVEAAVEATTDTTEPAPRASFWREFGEGLRFFLHDRILTTVLIAVCIVTLGSGAIESLGVFFVTQNLHTPASMYGFLGSALGAGAVVGALFVLSFVKRIGIVRTFWAGLIVIGLLILLLARMTVLLPAIVCFFLIGLPNVAVNTAVGPLLMHATPHQLMGRVFSVFTPIVSLVGMISISIAGYLASTVLYRFSVTLPGISFHSIDTILTGTGILVILGGIYAFLNLRRVSLEDKKAEEVPVEGVEPGLN